VYEKSLFNEYKQNTLLSLMLTLDVVPNLVEI